MNQWTQKDIDWLDDNMFSDAKNGERHEFVKELEADPAKMEAFQTVKLLQSATRLEKLQEKLAMLREYDATLESKPKRRWLYMVAAAASILILIVITWGVITGPGGEVGANANSIYYAENFQRDFVMHDADHGVEFLSPELKLQKRAYDLYALGAFEDAIPYLDELWTNDQDVLALFYLIVSYHDTGQEKIAREFYNENSSSLEQNQIDLLEEKLFK